MDNYLSFHHIGIACRQIARTQAFYEAMGYDASPVVDDPIQHVRVCFLTKAGEPCVELLEPLDGESPVARILATVGVSPYHMCYKADDIAAAIARLREQRFLLVSGPVPACAMGQRQVAFLFNKNVGLIELVESSPVAIE